MSLSLSQSSSLNDIIRDIEVRQSKDQIDQESNIIEAAIDVIKETQDNKNGFAGWNIINKWGDTFRLEPNTMSFNDFIGKLAQGADGLIAR